MATRKSSISKPRSSAPEARSNLVPQRQRCWVGDRDPSMGAGLVLETQDGTVRLDYRFATILGSVWEKEMKNVSTYLFG